MRDTAELFDLTGKLLGQSAAQRWRRKGREKITLSWTLNPRTLEGPPMSGLR